MKQITKAILLLFTTLLYSNNMNINNTSIKYNITNDIDMIEINKNKIFQNNLWTNSKIQLNILSYTMSEIKIKLQYMGNNELGYIYTLSNDKNNSVLNVELYEYANGKICNLERKSFFNDKLTIINNKLYNCKPLNNNIISLDELLSIAKENNLKNILTKNEIRLLFIYSKLTDKTLTKYNNIAYYLQKAGASKEAIFILEKILSKYPNRTVAHYNIADAYWDIDDKENAIKHYKIYVKQMKQKGKQNKIPNKIIIKLQQETT